MSDVVINVTVTQGGTIDADLEGATTINTVVEQGGILEATITGGGTGPPGVVDETGLLGYVNHGSTASTARPTGYGTIFWYGSVEPDNAIDNDVWVDIS